ncbi:hypothetical protein ACSQ67_000998 [Phaseolus vulgaris]
MEIPKHAHANRSYEDFDPLFVWRREEGRDTLELHLPGIWKRFKKEFEIPSYCNDDAIHGNMMQSILSVVMPKKSPLILHEEQEMKEEKRGNKRKGEISEENDMTDHAEYQFEEEDDKRVAQETTRDVALKFMLVMVLILVAASYISDVSKSLMAQAHSYFHN